MADGKPGPLDGILEEAAKTQEEVRQNNQGRAIPTVDHPASDGVQPPTRIREVYPTDVEKLNARIIKLEAMILAMRGLVGASIVGVMYAIYKIRKIEKGQKALEPGAPKAIDVKEVETSAPTLPASSGASSEVVKVGD